MPLLMILTVVAIAGFQVYWISKTYEREERTLEMRTNMLFRETMRGLQTAKLKLERLPVSTDSSNTRILVTRELPGRKAEASLPREKMIGLMDVVLQKAGDSSRSRISTLR